jgi:predicted dehydrogenase
MLKIALLGTDSTHSDVYANLLNCTYKFPLASVHSIWGENYEETCKKAKKYNIKNVFNNVDKAIEGSDIVIICSRYGEDHYLPAVASLRAKKPTFVDKPFVKSFNEANELSKLAKKNKIPLVSFSPLRFADELINVRKNIDNLGSISGIIVNGPANSKIINEKKSKNIFYYGIHAVDIMKSIITDDFSMISVNSSDVGIWVNLKFKRGMYCTLNLAYDIDEKYSVALFGSSKHGLFEVKSILNCFENTLKFLFRELTNYKIWENILEQSVNSIELLNKINKQIKFKGS